MIIVHGFISVIDNVPGKIGDKIKNKVLQLIEKHTVYQKLK